MGKPLLQPFPTEVLMQSRKGLSSSAPICLALSESPWCFPKLLRKHNLPQKKPSETIVKFSLMHLQCETANSSWLIPLAADGGTPLSVSLWSHCKQWLSNTPYTAGGS